MAPFEASLPSRSATVHSTGTTFKSSGSASDDEALLGEDTSEV